MLNREKLAGSIEKAADKAGNLVGLALAIACLGLLIAGAALVIAVRSRPA